MTYVKAAELRELKEGKAKCARTKTERIVLVKLDGEIYAMEDRCTHDDAPICGGEIENGAIVCPRHGAKFDIKTGEALSLPATESLEIYKVRVNAGDVEVETEQS